MSASIGVNWREEVGGLILACGDIELITYRIWADLRSTKKAEKNFKARINELIKELGAKDPANEETILLLRRALALANKRNIVAHSPLQLQAYQHRRTGNLQFEHAIVGSKSGDYIDDTELRELRAEAESIVAGLYIAYQLELLTPARS